MTLPIFSTCISTAIGTVIRSSRRLEAETHRNLEVIWLLRRLRPDFKTIADFRRTNRAAFRRVFREFVRLCRKLDLYGRELLAVDGTRIKAVNNRDRNFTEAKLERELQASDGRLERYLEQLDGADTTEAGSCAPHDPNLAEKIAATHDFHGTTVTYDYYQGGGQTHNTVRVTHLSDAASEGSETTASRHGSPPSGLPLLPPSPSSMRAAATTPVEPAGARVARFPADTSLPRDIGGSASTSHVSRPARRSLALRPAWSLGRPRRPFCRSASNDVVTSFIRPDCYRLERQLPGGIRTR